MNPVSFGDFLKLLLLGSFHVRSKMDRLPNGSPSDNEQKSKFGIAQASLKGGFCLPGAPMVNPNSLSAQRPHLADRHIKSACSSTILLLSASLETTLTV